jgi:hypothetical protein
MHLPKQLSFLVTSHPKQLCMTGGLNTFSLRFFEDDGDDILVSSCVLVEKLGIDRQ